MVDVRIEFRAPGRLGGNLGANWVPERAPIAPLPAIVPAPPAASVPVVWFNWGNRPDKPNLSPTALHRFNPDGSRSKRQSALRLALAGKVVNGDIDEAPLPKVIDSTGTILDKANADEWTPNHCGRRTPGGPGNA